RLATTAPQNTVGAGIDKLTAIENLTGSAYGDALIGNASANTLSGAGGNDTLYGNGGDDTLYGGEGNDLLDGGLGADTMAGGVGDDTYFIDNARSEERRVGKEGRDGVRASVRHTIEDNVKKLVHTGSSATDGTGNDGSTCIGFSGVAIRLSGAGGNDTLYGNGGDDTLYGGEGNDLLDGGLGADTMAGGVGDDTYFIDNA